MVTLKNTKKPIMLCQISKYSIKSKVMRYSFSPNSTESYSSEILMQYFYFQSPFFLSLFHTLHLHSPPNTHGLPFHTQQHTHRHTHTGSHTHMLQPWVHTSHYTSTTWYFGPRGNCFLLLEPCTPNLPTSWTIHPSNFIFTIEGSMNTSLTTPTSNRINHFLFF